MSVQLSQNNNYMTTADVFQNAVRIQRWIRGTMCRMKRLPNIIYAIQRCLKSTDISFSQETDDGRMNSCLDEYTCIQKLSEEFGNRIRKAEIRMWYDFLAYDYRFGWIPVNVKSTTMTSHDNIGNLTMCVYSYTNVPIDLSSHYDNGKMSKVLMLYLKKHKHVQNNNRDYYFLVLNKRDQTDVVVNSLRGLEVLTPNINNLPFQVCWNKNRTFRYGVIRHKISKFIKCLKHTKPSWKERFLNNIRRLH